MALSVRAVWTPDLFVSNLIHHRMYSESGGVDSDKPWPPITTTLFDDNNGTIIKSFQASVNCRRTHCPKDESRCSFEFGNQYGNICFMYILYRFIE